MDSLGNILYSCTLLHIICEHLHDFYTLNFLSGWKGLKKFIQRDSFNSSLYILFSMIIWHEDERYNKKFLKVGFNGKNDKFFEVLQVLKEKCFFREGGDFSLPSPHKQRLKNMMLKANCTFTMENHKINSWTIFSFNATQKQ